MAFPAQDHKPTVEDVLRTIERWSIEEQVALAETILQRVHTERQAVMAPPSVMALRGLLANGQPAPSDEETARWLDEARWEKYGR